MAGNREGRPGLDWPRIRFTLTLSVWGASVGASIVLFNFLTRADSFKVVERMSLSSYFLFGAAGFLSAFVLVSLFAYVLYGGRARFYDVVRKPRKITAWLMLGLGYGSLVPLVGGAFFIPVFADIVGFADGMMSVVGLLVKGADLVAGAFLTFALTVGLQLFYTAIFAGLIFGFFGWVIDRLNGASDVRTANYWTWAVSLGLSIGAILIASFGQGVLF